MFWVESLGSKLLEGKTNIYIYNRVLYRLLRARGKLRDKTIAHEITIDIVLAMFYSIP